VGGRANGSAIGAFLEFFVELKSIQISLHAQDSFTGWTDEIGKGLDRSVAFPFDDFQLTVGVGPYPSAITTFKNILAITVRVQVNFNMSGVVT
jgi:hypothetical protein